MKGAKIVLNDAYDHFTSVKWPLGFWKYTYGTLKVIEVFPDIPPLLPNILNSITWVFLMIVISPHRDELLFFPLICTPILLDQKQHHRIRISSQTTIPPSQSLMFPRKKSQDPTPFRSPPFGRTATFPLSPVTRGSPRGPHRVSSGKYSDMSGLPQNPFETGAAG